MGNVRESRNAGAPVRRARPLIWLQLDSRGSETQVQIAAPGQRPPIVQEDFQRTPIGNPAQYQNALPENPTKGGCLWTRWNRARDYQTDAEYQYPDRKRAAADAEKILQIAGDYRGAIFEEILEWEAMGYRSRYGSRSS